MLKRENYNDLYDFFIVVQEKSFIKAAKKIGISSPALSRKLQLLENKLGVKLLNRTTRKMSLTQAGELLFRTAEASFTKLNNGLNLIEHYRNSPSGVVRITSGLQAIDDLLIPKLAHFRKHHPDIHLELISESQFVDIIAERYDAGIRLGSDVAENMVAVRISKPITMAVVASTEYFQEYGIPKTIKELEQHQCICFRLTNGSYFQWEFTENGKKISFSPKGQWILNDDYPAVTAAKLGLGIAYLPEDLITDEIKTNQLIRIFAKESLNLPALHLYYPDRNVSPALRVVIDCLKNNI